MGSRSALRGALLARQRSIPASATSCLCSCDGLGMHCSRTPAFAWEGTHCRSPLNASPCSFSRGFTASAQLPGNKFGPQVRPLCLQNQGHNSSSRTPPYGATCMPCRQARQRQPRTAGCTGHFCSFQRASQPSWARGRWAGGSGRWSRSGSARPPSK